MKILCLDVGEKRIGLAVSDELGIIANGLGTIRRKDIKTDISKLKNICTQLSIDKILIGVPYNIDGSVSRNGEKIIKLAKKIEAETALPVDYINEAYTTVDAQKYLLEADMSRKKRKKVIDKLSAVIMLQEYLEQQRTGK